LAGSNPALSNFAVIKKMKNKPNIKTEDGKQKVEDGRRNLKKQSQFAGLRPEIRNTKSEIRNLWILEKNGKQSQFGLCSN